MSGKPNTVAIGAFVVGALFLLIVATIVFGGAELTSETDTFQSFFKENTNGLKKGSSITFNGVKIGEVTEIAVLVDQSSFDSVTRATYTVRPDTILVAENGDVMVGNNRRDIDHDALLQVGLRARLTSESLITGQLAISISFEPDTEIALFKLKSPHRQVPTLPSSTSEIMMQVQNWVKQFNNSVAEGDLLPRVKSILAALDELSHSSDLRGTLSGLNQMINSTAAQQLAVSAQDVLTELNTVSVQANRFLSNTDQHVNSVVEELTPLLQRAKIASTHLQNTLASTEQQLSNDSFKMRQLERTMDSVERAASSMDAFFNYLERNPQALIQGK